CLRSSCSSISFRCCSASVELAPVCWAPAPLPAAPRETLARSASSWNLAQLWRAGPPPLAHVLGQEQRQEEVELAARPTLPTTRSAAAQRRPAARRRGRPNPAPARGHGLQRAHCGAPAQVGGTPLRGPRPREPAFPTCAPLPLRGSAAPLRRRPRGGHDVPRQRARRARAPRGIPYIFTPGFVIRGSAFFGR
ncbi:unnamed protein product, partial [Prorocentrum cordatum]